jgi:ankyrin repeat protein
VKRQRDLEAIRLCVGVGIVLLLVGAIYFAVTRLSSPNRLMQEALARRDPVMLQQLISQGANVNAPMSGYMTPLMYAAMLGDTESIKLLVKHGAKVNEKAPKFASTPLIMAIPGNNGSKAAKLLLDLGADPNEAAPMQDATTPLLCAEQQMVPDVSLIKALLAHGANPNTPNKRGTTPLKATSDKKIKRILIAAGAK